MAHRPHGGDGWNRSGASLIVFEMLKTITMTDELSGKRVIILGLARQGKALARFATQAGAEVVVSDLRSPTRLQSSLEE